MQTAIAIGFVLVLFFGLVVMFGAPYLPTLRKQTKAALDLLDLKPGQTLLELGCGDGRVARAAAKRGINVVGYELNIILVIIARLVTWKYRRQVKIIWGNYWTKPWPKADGIFVFLLTRYMQKLDEHVRQYGRPVKLVSFAFEIPSKKPVRTSRGLFLYHY